MASVIVPGQLEVDVEDVEHLHPLAQQVRPRALQVQQRAQRLAECQQDDKWSGERREVVAQAADSVDSVPHDSKMTRRRERFQK